MKLETKQKKTGWNYNAKKQPCALTWLVDRTRYTLARARKVLEAHGLPRAVRTSVGKSYRATTQSGPLGKELSQSERYCLSTKVSDIFLK